MKCDEMLSFCAEERFLNACARARVGELQPALHGTHESNLSSIYSQGLLIPGQGGNSVRIANGSVYGVGIYTAYVKDASLSWSYSRGESRPVLVCGVLDPRTRKDPSREEAKPGDLHRISAHLLQGRPRFAIVRGIPWQHSRF